MEIQGPMICRDPFAMELLRFNRGGIVSTNLSYVWPSRLHFAFSSSCFQKAIQFHVTWIVNSIQMLTARR